MIFDENRLLADDSHVISYLIFVENWERCLKMFRLLQSWLALLGLMLLFAYLCRLLITFANNLDPDQAWHFVGPDPDPICLTLW